MHPETTDLEEKKIRVPPLLLRVPPLFGVPPSGGLWRLCHPPEGGTPNKGGTLSKPEVGAPKSRRRARGLAAIGAALFCLPVWNLGVECGGSELMFYVT